MPPLTAHVIHTAQDFFAYDHTDSCPLQTHDSKVSPSTASLVLHTLKQCSAGGSQSRRPFYFDGELEQSFLIRVASNRIWGVPEATVMMIAAGGWSTKNTHAHWFVLDGAEPTQRCLCWEQHSGEGGGRKSCRNTWGSTEMLLVPEELEDTAK